MNLVIDVGNTRIKMAVFEDNRLQSLVFSDEKNILKEIEKLMRIFPIQQGILSSVRLISQKTVLKIVKLIPILELSSETNIPFSNLYKTPKTLGVDRIALIAAAVVNYPNKNTLVIDTGTCITFDFVNNKNEYLGGAISPGIEMRYKALHQFTSKLPLIKLNYSENIIGKTTEECINSGVLHGVIQEITGIISQYKNKFTDLTVVLTGGDAIFLSKQLKSSIFATENFLLEGLNEILNFNKAE
jgi:type III pantothenate kinase